MRLTGKTFLKIVNDEFDYLGLNNFKATEVRRTRYTQDQYESGACKLIVTVVDTRYPTDTLLNPFYFSCDYFLGEYQDYIDNGYTLRTRKNETFRGISGLEIEVIK